jgi:hypothetical protein
MSKLVILTLYVWNFILKLCVETVTVRPVTLPSCKMRNQLQPLFSAIVSSLFFCDTKLLTVTRSDYLNWIYDYQSLCLDINSCFLLTRIHSKEPLSVVTTYHQTTKIIIIIIQSLTLTIMWHCFITLHDKPNWVNLLYSKLIRVNTFVILFRQVDLNSKFVFDHWVYTNAR